MFRFIRYTFYLIFLLVHGHALSQTDTHWESIIQVGDSCRYWIPDRDMGTDWQQRDFDDEAWDMGQSGIGYNDNDDNTTVPAGTMSVYMRFEFSIQSIADLADLILDVDYDDGFVAYLNGAEVARGNMQDPLSWNMQFDEHHEAIMYNGLNPERFDLDENISSLLHTGRNILAVEVHNNKPSSSDMSSNVFLHAEIAGTDSLYAPVPDWFWTHVSFTEFSLPLMMINTNGKTIPNEPRIVAEMGLINKGEGAVNTMDDSWNEYDGMISIEIRGESSSDFPKKSYSIELQNADGSNNNVSILGLPEENDFILYGPFSDRTLVKNVLSYEIFRMTGRWAPRTRYIELALNGDYQGVYVLTEKLKRDENRVDVDRLTSEDVSPEDISGGYVLRRDKKGKLSSEEWWRSPVDQPYHERMWYEYYDPEYDELTQDQARYIKDWMEDFDRVLSGSDFADVGDGYRKYIRTKSFIDMMFLNEISKGIDNYLFSTYFHKENDADGGQLVAGPPWDYNLGYGNLDYGDSWDAKESYGWCYPQGSRVYWYERLMDDEIYRNKVYCRWTEFRDGIYSDENLLGIIDSCIQVLGDAVDRNFDKFPTLGRYVWPAIPPYPETYEGEISNLKSWLIDRLAWMDEQWLDRGNCHPEPPTDIMLSNNTILENQSKGSIIGSFSTSDPDSDKHVYRFVRGEGDTDNSKFSIFGKLLMSDMVFDYDTQSSFSIRVESVDEFHEDFEKVFELHVSSTVFSGEAGADHLSFVLYPNPSADQVQIASTALGAKRLNVQLVDLSGKVLANFEGPLPLINEGLAGASRSLDQGMYVVSIQVDGNATLLKFIKL